jgi:hypothetical protein
MTLTARIRVRDTANEQHLPFSRAIVDQGHTRTPASYERAGRHRRPGAVAGKRKGVGDPVRGAGRGHPANDHEGGTIVAQPESGEGVGRQRVVAAR